MVEKELLDDVLHFWCSPLRSHVPCTSNCGEGQTLIESLKATNLLVSLPRCLLQLSLKRRHIGLLKIVAVAKAGEPILISEKWVATKIAEGEAEEPQRPLKNGGGDSDVKADFFRGHRP